MGIRNPTLPGRGQLRGDGVGHRRHLAVHIAAPLVGGEEPELDLLARLAAVRERQHGSELPVVVLLVGPLERHIAPRSVFADLEPVRDRADVERQYAPGGLRLGEAGDSDAEGERRSAGDQCAIAVRAEVDGRARCRCGRRVSPVRGRVRAPARAAGNRRRGDEEYEQGT
ncbi:hypothetical protein SPURM210S_01569 [Streptomyces purpurascens]